LILKVNQHKRREKRKVERNQQISLVRKSNNVKKLTMSAMLLAIGIVLPMFTGPQLGSILLPMHIPAILAGILVGSKRGLMVGMLIPILRSFLFGLPPLFPVGLAMAMELGTYALVAGLVYGKMRSLNMKRLYTAIVLSMLAGRVVFGIAMFVQLVGLGMGSGVYSLGIWFASVFLSSWVGIWVHLVGLPVVVLALWRSGVIRENL
jgi:hypothetical protein